MTYQIYSQQQLHRKSIARLKQIYSEIACTVEVNDKRCKDAWISAIVEYQASIFQKLTPDEQAQPVAPEKLTTVVCSFYDHEYYALNELIAAITHDNDLTQPWVVMVNGAEQFRANTWARCNRFIIWHHQDGTLNEPLPAQTEALCTTGNEVMAQIFTECEKYGFEILGDGIYNSDTYGRKLRKLGEVGYTEGGWWVIRAVRGNTERVLCQSALEAVWLLAVAHTQLLNRRFEMLTPVNGSIYGNINELLN